MRTFSTQLRTGTVHMLVPESRIYQTVLMLYSWMAIARYVMRCVFCYWFTSFCLLLELWATSLFLQLFTGVNNRRSHFCMLDLLFVSCNDNTAWWSSCFFLIYSAIFSSSLENNCNQKQFLIVTRSVSFIVLHLSQIAPPVIFLAASLDASSIFFFALYPSLNVCLASRLYFSSIMPFYFRFSMT